MATAIARLRLASLARGPGCELHRGRPAKLCRECWRLEPDPATLSATQGGIGDTRGFFLPPRKAAGGV